METKVVIALASYAPAPTKPALSHDEPDYENVDTFRIKLSKGTDKDLAHT
jgi:hypothetical protein